MKPFLIVISLMSMSAGCGKQLHTHQATPSKTKHLTGIASEGLIGNAFSDSDHVGVFPIDFPFLADNVQFCGRADLGDTDYWQSRNTVTIDGKEVSVPQISQRDLIFKEYHIKKWDLWDIGDYRVSNPLNTTLIPGVADGGPAGTLYGFICIRRDSNEITLFDGQNNKQLSVFIRPKEKSDNLDDVEVISIVEPNPITHEGRLIARIQSERQWRPIGNRLNRRYYFGTPHTDNGSASQSELDYHFSLEIPHNWRPQRDLKLFHFKRNAEGKRELDSETGLPVFAEDERIATAITHWANPAKRGWQIIIDEEISNPSLPQETFQKFLLMLPAIWEYKFKVHNQDPLFEHRRKQLENIGFEERS